MTCLSTLHSRFDTVGTSKSYDVLHSSGTSVLIPVMYDTNILVHIFYHDDYQFNKKKTINPFSWSQFWIKQKRREVMLELLIVNTKYLKNYRKDNILNDDDYSSC